MIQILIILSGAKRFVKIYKKYKRKHKCWNLRITTFFFQKNIKFYWVTKFLYQIFASWNRQIKPVSFETKRICVFTFLGLSTNTFFHKAHLVAASAGASKWYAASRKKVSYVSLTIFVYLLVTEQKNG